jgi:hypothetical protein
MAQIVALDRKIEVLQAPEESPFGEATQLANLQSAPAYILLGDPGLGKTTAFRREAGGREHVISVRDYLLLGTEWQADPLFLDAFDEFRAQPNLALPVDNLTKLIRDNKVQRWRVSCRAADWFGETDLARLKLASSDGFPVVARLLPLQDDEVLSILTANDVDDPSSFVIEAHKRGLDGWLRNPQSLLLLVKAVGSGSNWPSSRKVLFEQATIKLAEELNSEHRA